jgi:hypothetical protein
MRQDSIGSPICTSISTSHVIFLNPCFYLNCQIIASMRIGSGITWFDCFSEVSFPDPNQSTWRLKEKPKESEHHLSEEDAKMDCSISEVCAVFVASKLNGNGLEETIIKIRIQYVYLLLFFFLCRAYKYRIPWS